MLVVLVILGIVLAAHDALFVSASNAQVDMSEPLRGTAERAARARHSCAARSTARRRSQRSRLVTSRSPSRATARSRPRADRRSVHVVRRRRLSAVCALALRRLLVQRHGCEESRVADGQQRLQLQPRGCSPCPDVDGLRDRGNARARTYVYDVTAVDAAGKESSGTAASVTFATEARTPSPSAGLRSPGGVLQGLRP